MTRNQEYWLEIEELEAFSANPNNEEEVWRWYEKFRNDAPNLSQIALMSLRQLLAEVYEAGKLD